MKRFSVVLVLLAKLSVGQSVDTARVTGVVHDSSGAVISAAKVSVRSDATGSTYTVQSDGQGLYVTPPLPPGDYGVKFEAPGFSATIERLHLEVAQKATLDVTLTLGATQQTVEVQATAPLLEAETSTLSNVRTETAVKNLPLNGRNFAELMGLTAGVVDAHTQLTGTLALSAARGETSYSVNGLRPEENHFLLDGISDNENHNGLGVILFPPVDAVQEFRQETSVPDARYGHGGGGTVNLVFKSGTEQYHGDLFEFLRNSDFDASNFFDKTRPAFRMNQFGATFGGPLVPVKDPKTFFFIDYQGTRKIQGLTYISTVPTEAMRTGDFSEVPQLIYNPATQVTAASGGYARSAFYQNTIPASLIDPLGQKLINLYPLPNLPGIANNFLYQPDYTVTSNEGDLRIDRQISGSDNGFFRFSKAADDIFQPGVLPAPAVGGSIAGTTSEPSLQLVLSETHIFTPATVNTARLGWSRVSILSTDINQSQPYATQIGIPGSNIAGDPETYGLPNITVTGAASLGSYGNLPATVITNNYQFDDDVSLVRGRHTIQVGGEIQRLQYNVFQTANLRGSMSFSTAFSSDPAIPGTGLGLADLLLGKPISGSLQFLDGTRGLRRTDLAGYAQDDYKVNDRLTINIGVRYENYLGYPWTEVDNRMYQFVPTSGVVQVGTDGVPRSGVSGRNLNFMPRVGFAYRLSGKTVFRSAYGIFYSAPQIGFGYNIAANPPELISTSYTNSQFNFAGAVPASAGFARPAAGTVLGSALYAVDPNEGMPYTQQWNVSVQHQITPQTLVTVAYVGTAGTHLQGLININQPVPGITALAQRRPYPLFQNITDVTGDDTSRYNALQVIAEKRVSHGLSFNLSYTWSHALDDASFDSTSGGVPAMDTYNRRLDYGNADYDIRNRFVGSATYMLPFKTSGPLRYAVQGWQLNGILSLYSGIPFSVQSASNTLNIGGTSRAEFIGPGNGSLPSSQQSLQEWFDVAAFSTPPTLAFGNSGRNILTGPSTKELDFSAFKNFYFSEGRTTNLQLRVEAFNLTNTPQFNNPNSTVGAPGAGSITSAGSPYTLQRLSREVQLALKFYF